MLPQVAIVTLKMEIMCKKLTNYCSEINHSLMLPQVAIVTLLDVEPISDLLTAGRRSKTSKTKTLSTWATKEIRYLPFFIFHTLLNLMPFSIIRKLKNATSTAP